MDSRQAIERIKNNLIELIKNGKLNATTEQNDNSISFYVYKTPTETIPLLTLRISDHRPTFQKYIKPRIQPPSEEENTNISVEFYKIKRKEDGSIIRNRINNGVNIPHGVDVIKPFTISSFSYMPKKLNEDDIDIIYQSIIEWIYSEPRTQYIDPFAKTDKAAVEITNTANIKIKDKSKRTIENKQYINISKTIMKLNEEQLKKLIRESITMVVNEGFGVEPHRTNITCYGLNLEMSMNGEDIIVEYADENMWVLAIYCAKDKTWHIQENLDNDDTINNNEENIIDIGDTKSMPSALFNLSTYVSNKKNNIRR